MGILTTFLQRVFIHGENPFANNYEENRLRPPGAVAEKRFMALCIRCNRCLEVCPYGSIKRDGLGPTIGTPYILPEAKGCYLCMACCRLCPTGALDRHLLDPEKVVIGKAKIDPGICYSQLFLDRDRLPQDAGNKIGALCNTCYNVCPLPDKAIRLEKNLFPVILDGCVGCGICVERCPTRPRRAVTIVPTGMGRPDEAGFYFRRARRHYDAATASDKDVGGGVLTGEKLIEQKAKIQGSRDQPAFQFPYEIQEKIDGWD